MLKTIKKMPCIMPGYLKETVYHLVKPMRYVGNKRGFLTLHLQETVGSFVNERTEVIIQIE